MSKKPRKEEQKEEQVIYYDDNSTISDMSQVDSTFNPIFHKSKQTKTSVPKGASRFSDKWKTYSSTVKLMVFPMLVVLAILFVLYLLIMLVPSCAA